MTVARFKGLGDEPRVGFCGTVLVFHESFRHFKTTVMNWHNLVSDCEFRIADRFFFPVSGFYFPVSLSAGLPLTSAASRPATETQGPTTQLQKLAAGRGINTNAKRLQASILGQDETAPTRQGPRLARANQGRSPLSPRRFRPGVRFA